MVKFCLIVYFFPLQSSIVLMKQEKKYDKVVELTNLKMFYINLRDA